MARPRSLRTLPLALLLGLPLAALLAAPPAAALCTFYTDPKFPTMAPEVLDTDIRIRLHDGYAVVEIAKTFRNPDARTAQVGDIIFPLPSEMAFITALALSVDGVWHNATVVEREQGRRNFSEAVDEGRDASLLEHLGGSQYALRVTLPPEESRTLTVRYEEPLHRVGGQYHFRYPLTEEALSAPQRLRLDLEARTAETFGRFEVTAPRGARVERPAPDVATVAFEARGAEGLREDLALGWTTGEAAEMTLLVERQGGGSHFVARLVPGPGLLVKARPLPLDLVVLVDASGSMGKARHKEEALKAVGKALGALGPGDRLEVVAFRSQPHLWSNDLVEASHDRKDAALGFLRGQEPRGSTNLMGALDAALKVLREEGREGAQPSILVVSDGDLTSGLADGHGLVHLLGDLNRARGLDVAVHTLQVGDVERQAQKFDPWGRSIEGAEPLLETVARENHGVGMDASEAARLRAVLEGPGRVLLRNVTVQAGGPGVSGVSPSRVPLLLEGGELLVAGRAVGEGVVALTLRGEGADGPVELRWELDLAQAAEHPRAERVGAMLRLRGLLEDLRLRGGHDQDLVAQVKALAGKHGYVTPYTSLLVDVPASRKATDLQAESNTLAASRAPPRSPMAGMGLDEAHDSRVWFQDPRALLQHPLVQDREVDRLVLAGSAEHHRLQRGVHRLVAWAGPSGSLMEADGQVVLVGDGALLQAAQASLDGPRLVPGFDAGALLAVLALLGVAGARRRRPGA